jgi:hypothetical protein
MQTLIERPQGDQGDLEAIAAKMLTDPVEAFGGSYERMHSLEKRDLEALQLAGLKMRFEQLRNRVPMLKKLADEIGVFEINSPEDVVPLLFNHTVYKSYPISFLEKNRFTQMNQWLQKLTTVDLSGIDVSKCEGIDEWIAVLDAETPLNLRHSSGTTGTVSFLPRTKAEAEKHYFDSLLGLFQTNGLTPPTRDKPVEFHVLSPNYRSGTSAHLRGRALTIKYLCNGDESKLHVLYPYDQSADLMFLAGRMRAAEAKGELDRLQVSPALLARKADFDKLQKSMASDLKKFISETLTNLRGEQIYLRGTWNILYKVAEPGLAEGLEGVVAPNSLIGTGGGAKGQVVPANWEEVLLRFFGVPRLNMQYGMSEVMASHLMCGHERYHIEPWSILFLLDPDTGEILPRTGVQTGRAAFYDLQAESYWGGFVSGDEVTVDWSPCACGRKSPHIARTIERYSEKRGGDDKITCAASPEAHESALGYLTDITG